MDIIGMIVSIFCMFDPVGNIPIVMPLVKDCTPKRQRIVIEGRRSTKKEDRSRGTILLKTLVFPCFLLTKVAVE